MTGSSSANPPLTKKQSFGILTSTILASSMAFIDSTALNVALPVLQRDLGLEASDLLWVVNGYALFLSALLLVGGALGDLYGRKKVFIAGIAFFTLSSIGCGLASSPLILITARSFQGVGAAMMVPGSLSLISSLFPKEKSGWAIGTWSMFSAMTTILGPALGGLLAGMGLWRMVFFINVPLAMIALYYLRTAVPNDGNTLEGKLDWQGALFATLGLAGLTYGFIEAPRYGFDDPAIAAALALGTGTLVIFVIREKTTAQPMMPLALFQSTVFSSANLITLLVYAALGGFIFFFPLNLIQVQGYPPEIAGITLLPFGLLIAFLSRWSGKLADRIGVRAPLILGPALTATGFFLFAQPGITLGPSDFWTTYLVPTLFLGAGMGITVAPLTTGVMHAVPKASVGAASGINNTIARSAGVLAVAMMGAMVLINFRESMLSFISGISLDSKALEMLKAEIPKLAEASAPADMEIATQQEVDWAIKNSFVYAFKLVAYTACMLAGTSSLIAFFFIRRDTG